MKDEILIASSMNSQIRIHAACTTQLCQQARQAHDLYPTSCAALGRVLTVTAIMASTLKSAQERIVTTINGHGEAGTIIAEARGNGDVRGFIGNPHIYLVNEKTGKLDVGRAVGTDGTLSVLRDMGLKEPFTGRVALKSGEIGDDFARYFALSEQTPSVVAVGVLVNTDTSVKAAGGLLIQLLPEAGEDCLQAAEHAAAQLRPISQMIDEGMSPEQIVRSVFPDAEVLASRPVRWHCGCSREGFQAALATLHAQDLQQMIEEDHGAEIICQYCGKKYQFSEADLRQIQERQHVADQQR